MKKITIILPAYNEEESFGLIESSMADVASSNPGYEFEFLIINDGSTDATLSKIQELRARDPQHWNYVDLSRNFGKEIAMMAGFDYATGDAVIVMDSDMQHPVGVIPEMIYWWEQGYDDVYAQRRSDQESFFKRKTSALYYDVLQVLASMPIQKNTGDFRLLDRKCVEALKLLKETDRNTKGLYGLIGFRKKGIFYDQRAREYGKTKWSFRALFNLAVRGFTSYSTAPLRLASIMGFAVSILAFIFLIYILIRTWIYGDPVAGYPTIMVTILLLGGVQLITIGILGEYMAQIYHETKHRPGYFVQSYNGQC